jgi:FAD/FMN-containing dehydrogenase
MMRGARFFDGRGRRIDVSNAGNSELLPALQTSLGMLGVVTRVCIQATRSYSIEETTKVVPFDELMEQWDELISIYRHFSFDWIPTDRSGQLYGLVDAPKDSCIVKLHSERLGDEPPVAKVTRTDRSYRIYPAAYEPNFYEMEYFMPIACGPDIVRRQREIMLSDKFDSRFPMQVRFVASDGAWLSPAYDRDSVVVSISGVPGTDYQSYLTTAEKLFAEHAGRPHWGKLHSITRDQLENLYPKFNDFVARRRELDPQGLFLNAHLSALFS